VRLWKLILVTVGIVAICLLCGLPVFGAPPKADVAAFLPSVDDAGRLIWTPTVLMDSGLTAAAPNTATGDSAALVDGKPRRLKWKAYIVFDGQPIPPGPTPPPVPPIPPVPPPVPVPTTLVGIVIEETKERTPAQAVVLLSPKVGALFKADGGQFRIVDPWDDAGNRRDVGVAMRPYVVRAEALKIKPCLFIVSPDGVVYSEGLLPAKVADVEALVAKIRKGDK
jgi:hypothetical protein